MWHPRSLWSFTPGRCGPLWLVESKAHRAKYLYKGSSISTQTEPPASADSQASANILIATHSLFFNRSPQQHSICSSRTPSSLSWLRPPSFSALPSPVVTRTKPPALLNTRPRLRPTTTNPPSSPRRASMSPRLTTPTSMRPPRCHTLPPRPSTSPRQVQHSEVLYAVLEHQC